MNKKNQITLFFTAVLITGVLFSSCKKDEYIPHPPEAVTIEEASGLASVAQEDTLYFSAKITSALETKLLWMVDGKEAGNGDILKFTSEILGKHTVQLTVTNPDGSKSASADVEVYGKYRHGTFVLSEGNMSNENGILTFISERGVITDSAYHKANKSFLGNVSQDMFIADGKIYVISQNGNRLGGDGMLVIANSETLKKEAAYNAEISETLSWPTHVAVIGQDIYIRDNRGIHLFNASAKTVTPVEGTDGARKNRMAVAENKLFVPGANVIFVIEKGKLVHTIQMPGQVSGVIKASDGNIYASCTSKPSKIIKIKASDYSFIQTNDITDVQVGAGWGATPGISAKGDTLYFSNATTKIYRHIFSKNQTAFMVDVKTGIENANIVYNNLAVHPVTGRVYFNTIKAYPEYLKNNISVWKDGGSSLTLENNYQNHTHFPAGIFFTENFNRK